MENTGPRGTTSDPLKHNCAISRLGMQEGFGIRTQQSHNGVTIVINSTVKCLNQLMAINKLRLFHNDRTYRVFS